MLHASLVVPVGYCLNHVRLQGNDNITGAGVYVSYVETLGILDLV